MLASSLRNPKTSSINSDHFSNFNSDQHHFNQNCNYVYQQRINSEICSLGQFEKSKSLINLKFENQLHQHDDTDHDMFDLLQSNSQRIKIEDEKYQFSNEKDLTLESIIDDAISLESSLNEGKLVISNSLSQLLNFTCCWANCYINFTSQEKLVLITFNC